MEVVCPVGMFVYTAVYKLAADGAVFDTHENKSMVRGTPKRKPRYLVSRFTFSFLCATHTRYCLLYTSPSPRDATLSRMPSSA